MKYNFNGKKFQSVSNTENGEVSSETIFNYHQDGDTIWADYSGGQIVRGHLIGTMLPTGNLDFMYHHINEEGIVMAGKCVSAPIPQPDGKLKISEKWQWLTGDKSTGESELIEI